VQDLVTKPGDTPPQAAGSSPAAAGVLANQALAGQVLVGELTGSPMMLRSARTPSPLMQSLASDRAVQVSDLRVINPYDYTCDKRPPLVSAYTRSVPSGGMLVLKGSCFGDRAATVEVIGSVPGSPRRLLFQTWTDGRIEAVMPELPPGADIPVAVIVKDADGRPANTVQVTLLGQMGRHPVPAERFTQVSGWEHDPLTGNPCVYFEPCGANVSEGANHVLWKQYFDLDDGPQTRDTIRQMFSQPRVGRMSVRIDPRCSLDNVEASSPYGAVKGFRGWEEGPPNAADFEVLWGPICIYKKDNFGLASNESTLCRFETRISAWAYCPTGVTP
jgi:hypothetical protein